ncbi:UDP-2,3-diacylglucosamine hydrolase [Abyssogena phaseoliformis symbiont OG214]|uniref:UDP-2,3-diacylglucosamine diphosphatase n=1 Tax=Abyssogena phaseoliformis symbiont TaxID=596095 RepID=UPI001915B705|nr:UDP-2,3-diacylglucosamine diphosphatase [Abyssogena phaseoliformis symbiont]MBW5289762.1 UDP-2,3-diacylglucosamine diphosphatase [Candidatus Ruthia sp. Apha_13_S6]BBB23045.1 UDP-2,3-diacylglucosamine hydrolase [Abyssogena phaseoliformis symbiont OG214]
MSQTLIIADLHLATDEAKTHLFIKFCQEQAVMTDQLFILGDLFNVWLGDDLSIDYYQKVVLALKTLSLKTKIFIMTGNRDFLLGDNFAKQTNCILIDAPYLLEVNNQQYVLTHGDELCTDDKGYQRLKGILQHPITKFIFLNLGVKLRLKISAQLRQKSIKAQQHKSYEIMDVNITTVNQLMQKYPSANLIHGHTHRLDTHVNDDFTRYVLGDWSNNQGNAIEISHQLNRLEISTVVN